MGFLDRLLGRDDRQAAGATYRMPASSYGAQRAASVPMSDEQAVERYRYLLRTASPEAVEQVHREAFAKLTPDQRRLVFERLQSDAPAGEAPRDASAASLARSTTRSEYRQPGFVERSFGSATGRGGVGFGSIVGGSLLGTVAGVVVGSAIADLLLPAVGDLAADVGAGFDDFGAGVQSFGDDVFGGGGGFGDF